MSWAMGSWMEKMNYVAAEPGRPAVLISLAQTGGAPLDEISLAGNAGLMHQQITGQVTETAVMIAHIHELHTQGFLQRDPSGFKWELTALGILASRQWVPGQVEPPGMDELSIDEVRTWRDRVLMLLDHDAELAEQAEIQQEELIAIQSPRLAELHILNRVLGEQAMPNWLLAMRDAAGGMPTAATDDADSLDNVQESADQDQEDEQPEETTQSESEE